MMWKNAIFKKRLKERDWRETRDCDIENQNSLFFNLLTTHIIVDFLEKNKTKLSSSEFYLSEK